MWFLRKTSYTDQFVLKNVFYHCNHTSFNPTSFGHNLHETFSLTTIASVMSIRLSWYGSIEEVNDFIDSKGKNWKFLQPHQERSSNSEVKWLCTFYDPKRLHKWTLKELLLSLNLQNISCNLLFKLKVCILKL